MYSKLLNRNTNDMKLGQDLLKRLSVQMYSYKNDNQIFSEILAYAGYESSDISMNVYTNQEGKFLLIQSKDGGLSSVNLSVLRDINLGKSSKQNISFMGAGSRTAAAQWTKNSRVKPAIFGICDNKNCIIYKCDGDLGLQIVDYDGHYYKDNKFPINQHNTTYWILPWKVWNDAEKEDEWVVTLRSHLKFMYNSRLISGSLTFNFFSEGLQPKNNLFQNPTPLKLEGGKHISTNEKLEFFSCMQHRSIEKISESMAYKGDIFQSFTNWKVSMKHTRVMTKTGEYNNRGNPGYSLLITNQENNVRLYYHAKKPGYYTHYSDLLYDDNCNNFGQSDDCDLNEEFTFSFEIMTVPGSNISARRKALNDEYKFGNPGKDVHGVRILMKGKNGSNFVTKNIIGMNRGLGNKYGCIINIELNSEQYKKYAEPNINRNNQWDCDKRIKKMGDGLYDFICNGLANDFYSRLQKEEAKRKAIIQTNKLIFAELLKVKKLQNAREFAESKIDSLVLLQSFGRLILANYRVEKIKKQIRLQKEEAKRKQLLLEQQKERERKALEKKKNDYHQRIKDWIDEMESQKGNLYIRQTQSLIDTGIKYAGKPIFWIGRSSTDRRERRRDEYNCKNPVPEEDRNEKHHNYSCYDFKKSEDKWKNHMNKLGWNYKDILKKKGKKVTGEEWYAATFEEIEEQLSKVIATAEKDYKNLLADFKKNLKNELDYHPDN